MKYKSKTAILCLLFGFGALLLSSCASIVNGTTQDETITSVPRGAHVKIDGRYYGNTPVTASLRRKKEHDVEIMLPGYQPAKFTMEQHISGWYFGNLLIGGLVGLIVDYADGSIYKLEPSNMHAFTDASLTKKGNKTISVILAKNVPRHMKLHKIGQLKKRV